MFIGIEEVECTSDDYSVTIIFNDLIIDSDYYFVKNNLFKNAEYKYALRSIYKFLDRYQYPVCYTDFFGDE